MVEIVFAADAVPPLPVFSQAVISRGTVYASGSIGCNPDLTLVEGGIPAQTKAALENLQKVLKAAGTDFEHLIKANIFLTDMANFGAMNEVYTQFFTKGHLPARTCVAVKALPLGASVEIEGIAEIP
ncbi:Endoribonuclease L-PSP [Trametopsis cervina]|nr:Endoribonuclease L-PSP [Trametopsis cervina]